MLFDILYYKIGTLDRVDALYTPSPATYYPRHQGTSMPQYKIGTATRVTDKYNNNPAPGAYNIRTNFPSGPKYSMSSRSYCPDKYDYSPGPAAYSNFIFLTNNFY